MPRAKGDNNGAQERSGLVNAALTALGKPNCCMARRWTIATSVRYRQMVGPNGVYNRTMRFGELHNRIKRESDAALKLARRMDQVSTRMRYALRKMYGVNEETRIEREIGERIELARMLDHHVEQNKKLEPLWPKGGPVTLAKDHFGSDKKWLVQECHKVFFRHGDCDGIRACSSTKGSPFAEYIGAVYGLATGQDPWAKSVGLSTEIDKFARVFRKRVRESRNQ